MNIRKRNLFRDAFFFIVVYERKNKEPDYFRFFEGLSSRVRLVPVESSDDRSAPEKLINVAKEKVTELDATSEEGKVWFVIDTDRWRQQIHALRQEVAIRVEWMVAQSNPCFEVWLYFYAKSQLVAGTDA